MQRRSDVKISSKKRLLFDEYISLISSIPLSGISSLCFTNHGEALYMMSSSEVQRITLSAKKIVSPSGAVDLEEWEDDDDDDEKADKTEDGDENTTMEVTTPASETASRGLF